jgi:hypothetical protein
LEKRSGKRRPAQVLVARAGMGVSRGGPMENGQIFRNASQ